MPTCPGAPCENFLYGFKAAPRAACAADSAALAFAHASAPATAGLAPVGWRECGRLWGPQSTRETSRATAGFDKGTLAMTQIGQTGAGEKPARFASKRTGHRPLSNPAAPSARQLSASAMREMPLTLKCQRHAQVGTGKGDTYASKHGSIHTVNDLLTVKRPGRQQRPCFRFHFQES